MKKLFVSTALLSALVLAFPIFPAYASDCPEGCSPNPAPNGMSCQSGCWKKNSDGTHACCEELVDIVNPNGGCFIVTASGESRQNLAEMYWFRDKVLARTLAGRGILYIYYDLGVGQSLAPMVEENPLLAVTVRTATSVVARFVSALH